MSFLGVQMKRILFTCLAIAHKQPDAPVYFDRNLLGMVTGSHLTEAEARELLQAFYEKIFDLTLESIRDKYAEKIHIFSKVTYNAEGIELEAEVDRNAVKYIGKMIGDFTTFYTEEYCQIQSSMGQELYRQMKQWKSVGQTPEIDIEELKKFAGITPNIKTNKFKERVENSLNAFEKKGIFKNIKCEYIKKSGSKKFVAIKIFFDPQVKAITEKSNVLLSEEEVTNLKKKYGNELVEVQLNRIKEHPEWKGITYEVLEKWCIEKKEQKKKTKGNFCAIEQHDYDFEELERLVQARNKDQLKKRQELLV